MSYSISQIKSMAEVFDVPTEWAIERRKTYLDGQITYYRQQQDKMVKHMSTANNETRAFILSSIKDSQNCIRKLERQKKALVASQSSKPGAITEEMIQQAKEYPLDDFVEVRRGMALCPFHEDHHPSMSIHRNRFHCFACGAKGDSIEFMMKRDGIAFQEAVKVLAGRQ